MSCPEFITSPRGRQGIGVIQPQSGLDYPLVAPSDDIRYLIADFYFEYDDDGLYSDTTPESKHPLHIEWLYGVGCVANDPVPGAPTPVHDADIVIADANNYVVFDSTDLGDDESYKSFSVREWGDDYKIYEWLGNKAVCRLVVYTTWAPDEVNPQNYNVHIAPTSAVLDERAVYKLPKRLKSLQVLTTKMTRTPAVFQAGYNMRLTNDTPEIVGLRNRTAITFDVESGAGFGQYSDCQDEKPKYIYSINGIGPNQYGDFFLSAGDCLYARVPTTDAGDGMVAQVLVNDVPTIKIDSDCPPCCSCQDYVDTALYMNKLRNQYSRIGSRTHQVKLLHENNIDRWVAQRNCRVRKPLRLSLSPLSCPYMEVIAQFCNQCPECVEDVQLNVAMSAFQNGTAGMLVPEYTTINGAKLPNEKFVVNGGWPNFSANIGFVDKGASVFVRFLLKFNPKDKPYSISGTLTGTVGDLPITPCDPDAADGTPSQDTDTRALYCNQGCTDQFLNCDQQTKGAI